MADPPKTLQSVLRAAQRVQRAEQGLAEARRAFYGSVRDAQAAGVSLSAIARALGVSRQAVQKMTRR